MRYLSICSGIESATVAWHPLGWQAVAYAEIEPFPCAVLHHHYGSGRPLRMPDPEEAEIPTKERKRRAAAIKAVSRLPEFDPAGHGVPNLGDFTQITRADLRSDVDLLVGGTPCQDFSVAGLRAGLDGARGNLSLEFLRLAQRLRPRWLVWENVPGVLSSNGGRDFGAILGGMVELGFGVAYRVLDAQHVRTRRFRGAVPQRRRRVFAVGHLGDWRRAAAVLFDLESLSGNPAPRRQAGQDVAGALGAGSERSGGRVGRREAAAHHLIAETAGTLKASIARSRGSGVEPSDLIAEMLRQHPRPGSNSIGAVVAFGGNNQSGEIDVATALSAHGGPAGRLDFESETFIAFDCKASGRNGFGEGIVAPTLRAMAHKGSHGNAGGQIAVAFDTTQITSGENRSNPQPGDPCHPIPAHGHAPAIAIQECGKRTGASSTDPKAGGGIAAPGDPMFTLGADSRHGVSHDPDWRVRRLMPVECERLMGFPDDYTRVPWPNPLWEAMFPERVKHAADGPRYKALGNSKTVNCVEWLGERIDAVDAIGRRAAA